jgi:hypothetical protein
MLHKVNSFTLYKSELVLGDIILHEGCGWTTHVKGDIDWVNLVEQTSIVCKLLLHFELKVIHLEIVQWILKLK